MKRFYSEVSTARAERDWQVLLDGRPVKTQGGGLQIAPNAVLAEALAAEWREQGEEIDPAKFLFRDMTDYALDIIRPARPAANAKLLAFAETDTLCYCAEPEDSLYHRQQEIWDPIVAEFEAREDVRFARVSGIMPQPQTGEMLAKLRSRLEGMDGFTLAALQPLASLSASLCIGLAALEPDADLAALWGAANLEEEWQASLWGRDGEAEQRLKARGIEFENAAQFVRLIRL